MEFKDFSLFLNQTKVSRFVNDLAAGRIMSTLCKRCQRQFYPPQADCPSCLESDMEWKELLPEGILRTFTRIHVPPEHFAVRPPLMPFSSIQFEPCPIGILQLENGLTLMGWIPKMDVKKLQVGMRMRAAPFTLPDGKITVILEPLNP